MVDELEHPPFVMVHSSTCVPGSRFVTVLVSRVGVVMVRAVGVSTVHNPAPTAGVFPLRLTLAELTQIVWLMPALAVVARLST